MTKREKKQNESLNTKSFSDLLYAAKGKRSSVDFCHECDISPSMFSRYLNEKNKRSCPIEVLKKVAAHADPSSGVTFDILVAANGGSDSYDYGLQPDISINEVIGIITTALLMQQHKCQYPADSTSVDIMGLTYKPSWTIETTAIDNTNLKKWDFLIWEQLTDIDTEANRFVRQLLTLFGASHLNYIHFDKLTFIFSSAPLFHKIIEKTAELKTDSCVSLLLVDSVSKKIVQEHIFASTVPSTTVLSSGDMRVSESTLLSPDDNNLL